MRLKLLVKARAGADSYYQALVVDAATPTDARRAASWFLERHDSRLLTFDESSTLEVPERPAGWATEATPDGDVAAGGRVYVMRRLAPAGFAEVASLEYGGWTPRALLRALHAIATERRLVAVTPGIRLREAWRQVRCGLRRWSMLEPAGLAPLLELLEGGRDRYGVLLAPEASVSRVVGAGGVLRRHARVVEALVAAAVVVVEDGDVLCGPDDEEMVDQIQRALAAHAGGDA